MNHINATRVVAMVSGAIAGLGGMEHGLFEMLQGNMPTGGQVIDAIGPAQRLWSHGSEPAFTLVPNFLATGILASIVGLAVMIWSLGFIGRKHAAWVLLCLSALLFLVGGGFSPPTYALLGIIAAFKIAHPLNSATKHPLTSFQRFLSRSWLWFLVPCSFFALLLIFQAVFGYPLLWFTTADNVLAFNQYFGFFTFFVLGPLMVWSAITHDTVHQA